MEIILRSQARANGSKIYFTGEACKHGHVAYRYVQSGTCSQCIRAANGPVADDPNAVLRKTLLANFVRAKFRLWDIDRDIFATSMWAMAMSRHPELTLGDIDPHFLPSDRSNGISLYTFYCHADDVGRMRSLVNDLHVAKPSQFTIDRAEQVKKNLSQVSPFRDSTPPMNFK